MNDVKTTKQVMLDKINKMLYMVAYWGSYYRSNPHRFVADFLNINLKVFQKILLFEMMESNYFMYTASRG